MVTFTINTSKYQEIIKILSSDLENNIPNTVAEFDRFVTGASVTLQRYFEGKASLVGTEPIPRTYSNQVSRLSKSVVVSKKSPLEAIISANDPLLDKIQSGQEASEFDMKTKYPYGKKSRVSKDGKSSYLIICFRWGAKGKAAHFNSYIPAEIYNTQTSNLSLSWKTVSTHGEANAKGEMIQRAEYKWGDRVDSKNAYAYEKSRVWNGKTFTTKITNEGMVRMGSDTGGSNFITFRVISTKSPKNSWIRRINAVKPIDIKTGFEKTIELNRDVFIQNVQKAFYKDIENIIKS